MVAQVSGNGDSTASAETPEEPLNFRDFLDETINEPVPWIFQELIAEREQMLIYGEPKVGKSQLALQMAVAAALGKNFLKWENTAGKLRVVYVNFEIDEHPFMNRLADHVLAEFDRKREQPEQVDSPNARVVLHTDHIQLVNREIKDWLHFSDGIRTMDVTQKALDGEQPEILNRWKERIKQLRPDFLIFDTLSKMHSVNESENNTIQQVLTFVRKLSVRLREDGQTEEPIAHVIVHHSRKPNFREKGGQTADAIRGGSSIRAEVDVSLGLSGHSRKPDRWLLLEARNVAGENVSTKFDGRRFVLAEAEPDVSDLGQEEARLEKIVRAFSKAKVRGMSAGQLLARVVGKMNTRKGWAIKMKELIAEQAAGRGYFILASGDTKQTAKTSGPLLKNADKPTELYWIHDDSPWMKTDWMQEIMADWRRSHPEATPPPPDSVKKTKFRKPRKPRTPRVRGSRKTGSEPTATKLKRGPRVRSKKRDARRRPTKKAIGKKLQ